jgi:hypothetical protein
MCINILSQGLFPQYNDFFHLKNTKNSGSHPQKNRLLNCTLSRASKAGFSTRIRLTEPASRISKHANPRTIFLPILRAPRVLSSAEYALRVRHHYRDTTIARGGTCNATLRAVRIVRITNRCLTSVVHEAKCYSLAFCQICSRRAS